MFLLIKDKNYVILKKKYFKYMNLKFFKLFFLNEVVIKIGYFIKNILVLVLNEEY